MPPLLAQGDPSAYELLRIAVGALGTVIVTLAGALVILWRRDVSREKSRIDYVEKVADDAKKNEADSAEQRGKATAEIAAALALVILKVDKIADHVEAADSERRAMVTQIRSDLGSIQRSLDLGERRGAA